VRLLIKYDNETQKTENLLIHLCCLEISYFNLIEYTECNMQVYAKYFPHSEVDIKLSRGHILAVPRWFQKVTTQINYKLVKYYIGQKRKNFHTCCRSIN